MQQKQTQTYKKNLDMKLGAKRGAQIGTKHGSKPGANCNQFSSRLCRRMQKEIDFSPTCEIALTWPKK